MLTPEQRLSCPSDFQERINAVGGLNKYDEPNFRVVWGQSQEATIRAGGVWEHPEIATIEHYRGYRDVPADGGEPCWLLQQWMPAEFWGSSTQWYRDNFDPSCGLQILGGYPYSGRYYTVFPLKDMQLNSWLIDFLIPMIVWAKQISELQKKAVIAERKARAEENQVNQIEDSLRNAFPALGEIRSAAGLSCLSVVQKKMEAIEQHWQSGVDLIRKQGKGTSILN